MTVHSSGKQEQRWQEIRPDMLLSCDCAAAAGELAQLGSGRVHNAARDVISMVLNTQHQVCV
eukprot:4866982-Amphidinium_carterae.1